MAKKADLLAEAKELNLEVTEKNTITELEAAISAAKSSSKADDMQGSSEQHSEVHDEVLTASSADADAADRSVGTAKAGKRSAKALKESEEKAAKEERKAHATDAESVPAPKPAVTARPRIERQGKKFRAAAQLVDKTKEYSLTEALELAIKTSTTKFDATVELHVRLGVDPRHADQNIRVNLVLPAGTGKAVKVAVFAEADDVAAAKKAGADIAGNEEFLQQLDKGVVDFDVLIATPAVMPKLGKYARILGPKGLMPSPKSGTVTADVTKGITEAKAGRVEFRVDSTGIVHLGVGKVSFTPAQLNDNAKAVLASIKAAKPASIKGLYVQSIYITTSMGPSIRIATSEV